MKIKEMNQDELLKEVNEALNSAPQTPEELVSTDQALLDSEVNDLESFRLGMRYMATYIASLAIAKDIWSE